MMVGAKEDFTARLPPETLFNIIDCVPDGERNPCALVSRRWRAVAFDNHSSCWFKCERDIILHPSDGPAATALAIVQLQCRAQHASNVSIRLVFANGKSSGVDAVLRALPRALHRAQHLNVSLDFKHSIPALFLDALARPAPLLRSVDFRMSNSPDSPLCLRHDLFAGTAPKLNRLTLRNLVLPSEPLPQLQNVSCIRLDDERRAVWNSKERRFPEEVFVHSKALVELRLSQWHAATVLSTPQPATLAGLANLKDLALDFNSAFTICDLDCLSSIRSISVNLTTCSAIRCRHVADPRVLDLVTSLLAPTSGTLGVIMCASVGSGQVTATIIDKDNILKRRFNMCLVALPQVSQVLRPMHARIILLGISTKAFPDVWPSFATAVAVQTLRILIDRERKSEQVYLPHIQERRAFPALQTVHVAPNRPFKSTMTAAELCEFAQRILTPETLASAGLKVNRDIQLLGWTEAHDALFAPPPAVTIEEDPLAIMIANADIPFWARFCSVAQWHSQLFLCIECDL